MWAHDEILSALLAAASKHTPIAPSPLNPTQRESDVIRGQHFYQLRKTRPITRRPPEISPTLRFLKRKAYFEYQAHKRSTVVVLADVSRGSESDVTDVEKAEQEEEEEESIPAAIIVDSGSLLHVLQLDYVRRHGVFDTDIEKQMVSQRPLSRWQSPRQRLQFFVSLCLMSACLTVLTVLSLGALKTDRYFPD